jgi:hypothetical protein
LKNDNLKKQKANHSETEHRNNLKDACKISVPQDLQNTFLNLMNLIPPPHRHEKNVQQTVLKYLKLGGEELVRAVIESSKTEFAKIKSGNQNKSKR